MTTTNYRTLALLLATIAGGCDDTQGIIIHDAQDTLDNGVIIHDEQDDGGPVDGNCRTTADRLGDCLDDIVSWQNIHPGELPIIVFVDMKTRFDNALSAWDVSKIDALDAFVAGRLGSRQYRYSDLRSAVAGAPGANPREKLRSAGWPSAYSLRDRIVVVPVFSM